jgi:hypothetical protein
MAYGTLNIDNLTSSDGGVISPNINSLRNRIINGAMVIDQRNSGSSFTNSNASIYGLDRWVTYGLTSAVLTIQRSTTAPAGFINSQSVTISTSTTANDGGAVDQYIEGNNAYDLNWGTSSGQPITISFWVRSSVTGVYNYYIKYFGSSSSYYYITPYTISSANTWQYITLTIPAPPSAAGAFTAALNTSYMDTRFVISSSGTTANGTANTWSTTSPNKIAGSVDLASNSGATFYFTGVQLEKGSAATSFDYRPYGTELALCQRYLPAFTGTNSVIGSGAFYSATVAWAIVKFPVTTRVAPTGVTASSGSAITFYANGAYSTSAISLEIAGIDGAQLRTTVSGAPTGYASVAYLGTSGQLLFTGCEL